MDEIAVEVSSPSLSLLNDNISCWSTSADWSGFPVVIAMDGCSIFLKPCLIESNSGLKIRSIGLGSGVVVVIGSGSNRSALRAKSHHHYKTCMKFNKLIVYWLIFTWALVQSLLLHCHDAFAVHTKSTWNYKMTLTAAKCKAQNQIHDINNFFVEFKTINKITRPWVEAVDQLSNWLKNWFHCLWTVVYALWFIRCQCLIQTLYKSLTVWYHKNVKVRQRPKVDKNLQNSVHLKFKVNSK